MRGPHVFHESYYEHSCLVKDKEDVLCSDIPGSSYMNRLKRWWYGLFLLSYNDKRARTYYTSSEAMRKERMYHFRQFRNRIHPLSRFRNLRDCFMLFVFMSYRFTIHHNTSITYGEWHFEAYYVGVLTEMIIFIDVILNMCTGYIDEEERKVVLNSHDGLVHYTSTKLFIEVASAIPLQCILFLRYGSNVDCALCKINKFVLALKIISTFGLIRLYHCSNVMIREWHNYKLMNFFRFLRIYLLSFFTMMEYIELADMVVLLKMVADGKIHDGAYVSLLIRSKYALPTPLHSKKYWIFNIARVFKAMLHFPFSEQRRLFYLDELISLIAYVLANVFTFWTLIEVYSIVNRIHFADDKVFYIQSMVEGIAKCRKIPDNATKKLNKYFDYHYTKMKAMQVTNILYLSMPEVLKEEAILSTHCNFIRRINYFSEWPLNIIEDLVLMLKQEIHLRNDMIAEPWVQGEGLIVVFKGELAVFHDNTETGHLIEGDYFGEISLVTDQEMRTSTVIAVTTTVTLLLEKNAFRHYMRQHPELFYAMKVELTDKFRKKDAERQNLTP